MFERLPYVFKFLVRSFILTHMNFPIVRLLFMNDFKYKRTLCSLAFIYGFVQLRSRVSYRYRLKELAQNEKHRLEQLNLMVNSWLEDYFWQENGVARSYNDLPDGLFLLVALKSYDLQRFMESASSVLGSFGLRLVVVQVDEEAKVEDSGGQVVVGRSGQQVKANQMFLTRKGRFSEVVWDSQLEGEARPQLERLRRKLNNLSLGGD